MDYNENDSYSYSASSNNTDAYPLNQETANDNKISYKKISFGKISRIFFFAAIILGLAGIIVRVFWFFGGLCLAIAVITFLINLFEKSFVKPESRINLNRTVDEFQERWHDEGYQTSRYISRIEKADTLNKLSLILGLLIASLTSIALAVCSLVMIQPIHGIQPNPDIIAYTQKIKKNNLISIAVSCVCFFLRWFILLKIFDS